MSQPSQASLDKQLRIILLSVKALAAGYIGWTILITFILGLVVGLVVLGWGLWPVKWTDARPVSLSTIKEAPYRNLYLRLAADSLAAGRPLADVTLWLGDGWDKNQLLADLDKLAADTTLSPQEVDRINTLRSKLADPNVNIGPTPQAATPQQGVIPAWLIIVVLLVGVVVSVVVVLRLRSARLEATAPSMAGRAAPTTREGEVATAGPAAVPVVSRAAGGARPVEKTAWAGETAPPLAQYVTTYALGDDRYDMSFSIETGTGDFLGECGVGISETIGVGSPDKVTALEVWLFDKNDIRTVTKVLMSEHAYNDAAVRAKLAPKGEAVMIKKGDVVPLGTQTLKVNARIDDLVYGSGGLPNNSFFQQVTIELAAWQIAA